MRWSADYAPLREGLARLVEPWMPRWSLEGRAHLPRRGAWLLASNHLSPLDPVLWACALERVPHFVADPCVARWCPGPMLEALGVIVLSDARPRFPSLVRRAREVLARGEIVAMFPEGLDAFAPTSVSHFHRGMAALWERVGPQDVPLVPGAIITRQAALVEVPGFVVGRTDGSTLVISAYREVTLRLGPPLQVPVPFSVETATVSLEGAIRGLLSGGGGGR